MVLETDFCVKLKSQAEHLSMLKKEYHWQTGICIRRTLKIQVVSRGSGMAHDVFE